MTDLNTPSASRPTSAYRPASMSERAIPVPAGVNALLGGTTGVRRTDLRDPVKLVAPGPPELLDRVTGRGNAPARLARDDHVGNGRLGQIHAHLARGLAEIERVGR